MNKNSLLLAGASALVVGAIVMLGGAPPNTRLIAGLHLRAIDAGIIYVEQVVVSDDAGMVVVDAGGRLVIGDIEFKPCATDPVFCAAGGIREPALPCVFPVDVTCRRRAPGADAGRFFGNNVFRRAEASGNCRAVPCVVLSGDRAP